METRFLILSFMNWQDHFLIMKRWYYRLQGLNSDSHNIFSSTDIYQDDFFRAFFIFCYHLKDSLKDSGILGVEDYINTNFSLQLAGDIANFTKHIKFTKSPRTGNKDTKGIGQKYSILYMGKHCIVSLLDIESGGKKYNAFEVVEDCMNAWGEFLLSKSLDIPEMMEENMFKNFPKWTPDYNASKDS